MSLFGKKKQSKSPSQVETGVVPRPAATVTPPPRPLAAVAPAPITTVETIAVESVAAAPVVDVAELVKWAAACEASGDVTGAVSAYRQLDELGDADGAVLLGEALRKSGQSSAARAAFERGEQRGHREAAMCLGNLLSDMDDAAGARAAYERAIAAGSAIAVLNLGLLLAQEGKVDDALHYLYMARDNGDSEASWAIGRLLRGKGDLTGAAESYRAGADAGDPQAAYGLGAVLYDLGDRAGARAAFQRAHELGDEGAERILAELEREADTTTSVGAPTAARLGPDAAHEVAHRLAAVCAEVRRRHGACEDKAEMVRKAYFLASQPQAPNSRDSILRSAKRYEQEFIGLLNELQSVQAEGRGLWDDFTFLMAKPDLGMDKLLLPLATSGVLSGEELGSIMVGGIFQAADFGSTIDSFNETNSRLVALMSSTDGQ